MEKLKEIGADEVIDTSTTDFYQWVKDKYGKPSFFKSEGGVSVVINYIGGDTYVKSLRCLRKRGRLLTCGATAGYDPATDLRIIWTYELQVLGSNGWDFVDGPRVIMDMMADGSLKPVIHEICSLDDGPRVIKDMYERKIFGKVIFAPVEEQ